MRGIENAENADLGKDTRKVIPDIVKHCCVCQLKHDRPRRFPFSVRDAIIGEFNHQLQVNVVSLIHGNFLHVNDVGTGFPNGGFVNKMDGHTAWTMLRKFWVSRYADASDYIYANAGTNFNSSEFKEQAASMGSVARIAPAEARDPKGVIERYHFYLKTIYEKLCIDLPELQKEQQLSVAFRTVNDDPSTETGTSSTTLVFRVYRKIPGGGSRGIIIQRANTIRDRKSFLIKMKARRTIRESIKVTILQVQRKYKM